jgi:hypothetical protein
VRRYCLDFRFVEPMIRPGTHPQAPPCRRGKGRNIKQTYCSQQLTIYDYSPSAHETAFSLPGSPALRAGSFTSRFFIYQKILFRRISVFSWDSREFPLGQLQVFRQDDRFRAARYEQENRCTACLSSPREYHRP